MLSFVASNETRPRGAPTDAVALAPAAARAAGCSEQSTVSAADTEFVNWLRAVVGPGQIGI
ncbi:hypothetical protein [Micromonospora sp. NPDC005806]|uniref:hypothetical protein n=1 Tax=Micromonospora sp. NPDC005806 TaxID=3364234 RepID=UPI00367B6C2D